MFVDYVTSVCFPGSSVTKRTPSSDIRILEGERKIEYVYYEAGDKNVLFLVSHGRLRSLDSDSVSEWKDWGENNGVSFLLHNYPGYGETPGPVTTTNINTDLELLVQYLISLGWAAENIVPLGNSIGCGPTISLAANGKYNFRKVVLISPYTSCLEIKFKRIPISLIARHVDPYPCTQWMGQLFEKDVLILHGGEDDIVAPAMSQRLFDRLRGNGDVNGNRGVGGNHIRCVMNNVTHVYARAAGSVAIIRFAKEDQEMLVQELDRLKIMEYVPPASNSGLD